MKKKIFLITIVIISITTYLLLPKNDTKEHNLSSNNTYNMETEFVDLTLGSIIDEMINNMTIEQKIAQMLIIYYTKDEIDDNLVTELQTHPYGGIILTKDNIKTTAKTRKFVADLQKNSSIPLIVSIDEEGGSVQRLQFLEDITATNIPFMYDLGSTNDSDLAYEVGKVIGEELRSIGVNVDFAPVLDIFSNSNNTVIGKRSFSGNKDTVSNMAINLAHGLEYANVIPTYKHFPGHGDTTIDSHYDLPIINKTYEELKELELVPFQNAIANNAKMIMIGHIALPSITGDKTPSSLSKKIVTDILKNDMGYKGLVITDALNMSALTNNYTYEEIYTEAINAGVDLLLMPHNNLEAITYIKNNISEERINESVKKILTFKYTSLIDADEFLDTSYIGSQAHQDIINKIPNYD